MILLAAWTLWFQAYIYNDPVTQIYWRAPAAGSAILAMLLVWIFFDYRAPGRYRALHEFSMSEDLPPYKELLVVPTRGAKEEVYQLRKDAQGRPEYLRKGGSPKDVLTKRPEKITVIEDEQKHVFEPDRDAKGNFTTEEHKGLRYRDDRGLVMEEGFLGQVRISHTGWLFFNVVLNLLHLGVWFVVLWLILRFQWSHALGQAVVFWLVMTVFIVPMILNRAEQTAKERAAATVATLWPGRNHPDGVASGGAASRSNSVR
jgi:hypothetical protein